MTAAVLAVGSTIVGVLVGYVLRGFERRQDRRIAAYADVAGSFIRAVNAAAALHSLHLTLGDSMRTALHRDEVEPRWNEWTEYLWAFETHNAVLRIVVGQRGREALEALNDWFFANVRCAPPFENDMAKWGDEARVGPRAVA